MYYKQDVSLHSIKYIHTLSVAVQMYLKEM
jgi:hypothetical protein